MQTKDIINDQKIVRIDQEFSQELVGTIVQNLENVIEEKMNRDPEISIQRKDMDMSALKEMYEEIDGVEPTGKGIEISVKGQIRIFEAKTLDDDKKHTIIVGNKKILETLMDRFSQ